MQTQTKTKDDTKALQQAILLEISVSSPPHNRVGCNFSMDCCSNTRFSLEGEKNASGHL